MPVISTTALAALTVAVLARQITGLAELELAAIAGLLIYGTIEAPRLPKTGRRMLAMVAATAAAALWRQPEPLALIREGLVRACSFAALAAALVFLREAARTSDLIRDCGNYLIRQPPGRRYAVLTLGSHLIGLVLNFGVLDLLGTMVARSNTIEAAGGNQRIFEIRRKRMNLALLRGFSTMPIWSPLSLGLAVTLTAVHGLQWYEVVPLGMLTAALLMLLGWFMDRLTVPKAQRGVAPAVDVSHDWRPLLLLALLILAMMGLAFALSMLPHLRLIDGVMLAAPLFSLAWIVGQHRDAGWSGAVTLGLRRLAERSVLLLPESRIEVVMLGGAGFIGAVLARFISPEVMTGLFQSLSLPPQVILALFPWLVIAAGQLGFAPTVSVVLLGAAVPDPAAFGVPPVLMAVGFLGGWGLSTGSTPIAAATLMISRLVGVSTATIGRSWNGSFTLAGAILLALWLVGLDMFMF